MYFQYLVAVVKRTFQPVRGFTEVLLLIIALAIPGLARFAGLRVFSADDAFAYVGAAVVAFALLRLFFVAPYHLWRDQVGEIGDLKLELTKPERTELAHMATIRAEKRLELAAVLREYHWAAFTNVEGDWRTTVNEVYGRTLKLMGQAGVPQSFNKMFIKFTNECTAMNRARRAGDKATGAGSESFGYMDDMLDFLHGRTDAEGLALRLAKNPKEPELPFNAPAQPEEKGEA